MTEDRSREPLPKLELAGCVITDEQGRILLLHRQTPERQQWETPGGKIESYDKDPLAAAKREMAEELDIEVEILDMLGSHDFVEDGREMGYRWFNARITSGIPTPLEKKKHDKADYFTWEQLREMKDLSANTRNLVAFHFEQIEQAS